MKLLSTKEFHEVLAKVIENEFFTVQQFVQICKDSYYEMNFEQVGFLESAMFFNRYYGLNWDYNKLGNLGKFIRSGKFNKELELYV